MNWKRPAIGGALLVLAACTGNDADSAATTQMGDTTAVAATRDTTGGAATAELRDSTGAVVGQATLQEGPAGGVQVVLNVAGLEPGEKGVHIHETGVCEPPFESAGGHFNPDSAQHGLENPQGPHAGDLPNMTVDASGNGSLTETTDRFTLGSGERSLFDGDGAAIVVHADADDMISDPAGNAGARVACGVLERST